MVSPENNADSVEFHPEAEGLVFDLDGTVLHTMHHHWQAWHQVSKEYGFALTRETLLSMAGQPSVTIMQTLCEEQQLSFDVQEAAIRKQKLYASLAHETEVIPIVMETARKAKAKNIPVAIATGGSKLQVSVAMKSAGVENFFDAVVTCDDVEHGKPHPETFLKAAALIGVKPEKCVGFEDAPKGMEAIKNAGFLQAIDVTTLPGYPSLD